VAAAALQVAPYANLCGLFALAAGGLALEGALHAAVEAQGRATPPVYN
jgi:hypothetical protein